MGKELGAFYKCALSNSYGLACKILLAWWPGARIMAVSIFISLRSIGYILHSIFNATIAPNGRPLLV